MEMIGVRVGADLLAEIDAMAAAERKPRAETVRLLLKSAIDNRASELAELQAEVAQARTHSEAVLRIFKELVTGSKLEAYLEIVGRLAPELLEEE